MKITVSICLIVLLLWAILAVLQLWFSMFFAEFFIKMTVTAATVEIITLIVGLAIREYLKDKRLREQGYID